MVEAWLQKWIQPEGTALTERVRSNWGKAASCIGIACNALLFGGKIAVGMVSGSVAITADAFNNLSDASSSVVSLLGFKMADIDPRAEEYNNCFTISDKARCIAGGVLEAILQRRGELGL